MMFARFSLLGYVAFIVAPIVMIVIGSFGRVWVGTPLPEGLTLRWYSEVFADDTAMRAFLTSLVVGVIAVGTNLVVAPLLAFSLSAGGRRVGVIESVMRIVPVATPAVVLGLALTATTSRLLPMASGTLALLILGHIVLTMPYVLSPVMADMRERNILSLDRTAASLGATLTFRLRTVVFPTVQRSAIMGAIAAAAISVGEFQMSNLIAGFLHRPYAIYVYQSLQGATGYTCAAAVLLIALAIASALTGSQRETSAGAV